jgi:hypothetical protein
MVTVAVPELPEGTPRLVTASLKLFGAAVTVTVTEPVEAA